MQIRVSEKEISEINKLSAIQSKRAKHSITIAYLIDKWNRFILNVENGYKLTIDDYTNDLSVIDLLLNPGRELKNGLI